ncbi:MAG: hypothetical protein JSW03_04395 [Candidatus Eiseniibacteriota bacterium]|nr:MAG: hypothetical protein JSW03_04395 [Candidatus Eisenbacteria bacterium]
MKKAVILFFLTLFFPALLLCGCSSNVRFIKTDDSYVPKPKPAGTEIVFRQGKIARPHRVIGVIQVELGRQARRPELDALIIHKAREIGADGVMLIEYDIDRDLYVQRHHAVVGAGPWRRHVVVSRPRTVVKKTASGIAVIFE